MDFPAKNYVPFFFLFLFCVTFSQGHIACLSLSYVQAQTQAKGSHWGPDRNQRQSSHGHFYRKPQGSGTGLSATPCPEITSNLGMMYMVKFLKMEKLWVTPSSHAHSMLRGFFTLNFFLKPCIECLQRGSRRILGVHWGVYFPCYWWTHASCKMWYLRNTNLTLHVSFSNPKLICFRKQFIHGCLM